MKSSIVPARNFFHIEDNVLPENVILSISEIVRVKSQLSILTKKILIELSVLNQRSIIFLYTVITNTERYNIVYECSGKRLLKMYL